MNIKKKLKWVSLCLVVLLKSIRNGFVMKKFLIFLIAISLLLSGCVVYVPVPAETAAFALRCVASAVFQATRNALKEYPGLKVVFSGGVASNSMLREVIAPLNPIFCEPQYSTDNAMGVAVLTHRYTQEG